MSSRTVNTGRNAASQVLATIVSVGMGLLSRYFFNIVLGAEYLGLTSLFTTILGVLSFLDLGIVNVFTFCLYKPIAENDEDYIAVLLGFLRRFIHFVMVAIVVVSLCALPFLRLLATGADSIDDAHLYFYYGFSVLQTLSTYICTYQVCYVTACQKEYKLVPIRIWFNVIISVSRILAVILTENYSVVLIVGCIFTVTQQILTVQYIRKRYPIVSSLKRGRLKEADKKSVMRNLKAGIISKFASISLYQTDSLIISSVLNVTVLGKVANYATIKTYAYEFITRILTSAYASMGNVIAKESVHKQLDVFYQFLMVTEFLISLVSCVLIAMMTPVIELMFGNGWIVDDVSVFFMVFSGVVVYHVYAINILPTTSGRLDITSWFALVEGTVNLVVSIVVVNIWGLKGVYLGTLIAETVYFILEPWYIYKAIYRESSLYYYQKSIKGIALTGGMCLSSVAIRKAILNMGCTFISCLLIFVLVIALWSTLFWIFWHKDVFFMRNVDMVMEFLKRKRFTKG